MTPPVVLPLGRDALAWVQQGGRPTRAGWSRKLLLQWQSFWFERNLTLQNQLPAALPLHRDPLFILGLWRSGTTYLHDLLGACPGMDYPATWQCMSPASFRLQAPPDKGKEFQRPMDGMTIDNLSPQEDEFALLALGVPSVYRGFFDPRRCRNLSAGWIQMSGQVSGQLAGQISGCSFSPASPMEVPGDWSLNPPTTYSASTH